MRDGKIVSMRINVAVVGLFAVSLQHLESCSKVPQCPIHFGPFLSYTFQLGIRAHRLLVTNLNFCKQKY